MYKLTSFSMLQPKSSKTISPLHFAVQEKVYVSLVIKGAQNYYIYIYIYIGVVSSHFLCRRCALSCQPFFCPVCLGLAIGVACTMQSTGVLGYLLNMFSVYFWFFGGILACSIFFQFICFSDVFAYLGVFVTAPHTGPSTANLGCPANSLQNGYPRETEFKILWLPPSISKHLMDTDGMRLFYPTNIRELNIGVWTHLHQVWLPGKPCAWRSFLRPSPPVTAQKKQPTT